MPDWLVTAGRAFACLVPLAFSQGAFLYPLIALDLVADYRSVGQSARAHSSISSRSKRQYLPILCIGMMPLRVRSYTQDGGDVEQAGYVGDITMA